LKYNLDHMDWPNNPKIASAMGRDKDWVRCMRVKLREAALDARIKKFKARRPEKEGTET